MSEYQNPEEGFVKEGHFPNTGNIILEVHRLLAIFFASEKFATLCTNYPGEGFDPIHIIQSVEEDEITRLLLTLAVTARVIDDREGCVFASDSNCGLLQKDTGKGNEESLSLREACNKIIHATKIRYDIEEYGVQTYFNPTIYLYGRALSGKNWKATLDVVAFSKEYISHVCNF